MTATPVIPRRFYSAEEIASMIGGKPCGKDHWQCKCPAHDDRTASLSVSPGRNGDTLLDCKAGCDSGDVLRALGLGWSNLFREPRSNGQSSTYRLPPVTPRPTVTVTPSPPKQAKPSRLEDLTHPTLGKPDVAYPYVNDRGILIYVAVRFSKPEKSFRQARPDGNGGWIWNLVGIEPLPYRFPQLIEAISEERLVWIPEGEKDVERLAGLGLSATCNSGGAGKFPASAAKYFVGAHVVIIPDNDPPGRNHAENVAALLGPVAASVKVVALPNLPEKGDVSDWLNAGNMVDPLHDLVMKAAPWKPEATNQAPPVETERRSPSPYINRFQIITDEEIENLPPIQYLIDDLLPTNSLAEMHGPPGGGKSFLALDWAMCVASGRPFIDKRVRRGSAVYIVAEGSAGIGQRTRAWKHGRAVSGPAGVSFLTQPVNLMDGLEVERFIAAVREQVSQPVHLVVIDTFHRCFPGGDENSSRDVGIAIAHADRIKADLGCCVLLVHHTRKDGDTERGSTALRGAVDAMFSVKLEDESHLVVTYEKMKDSPILPPIELTLSPTLDSCVITTRKLWEITPTTISENHRKALKSLSQDFLDDGASSSEWLVTAGLKQATYYRTIKDLVTWGYVQMKKEGRGKRYTLTDLGHETTAITSPTTTKQLSRSDPPLLSPLPSPRGSGVVGVIGESNENQTTVFDEVDI